MGCSRHAYGSQRHVCLSTCVGARYLSSTCQNTAERTAVLLLLTALSQSPVGRRTSKFFCVSKALQNTLAVKLQKYTTQAVHFPSSPTNSGFSKPFKRSVKTPKLFFKHFKAKAKRRRSFSGSLPIKAKKNYNFSHKLYSILHNSNQASVSKSMHQTAGQPKRHGFSFRAGKPVAAPRLSEKEKLPGHHRSAAETGMAFLTKRAGRERSSVNMSI